MKFKTKEEIKREEKDHICPHLLSEKMFVDGFNEGVDTVFNYFKELIDFYEKYRIENTFFHSEEEGYSSYNKQLSVIKDEVPELYKKFMQDCGLSLGTNRNYYTWNDWFITYCFSNIKTGELP